MDVDRCSRPQPPGPGSRSGQTGVASLGKQTSCANPSTGATWDQPIVATFGHSCPTTQTTRKSERPGERKQNWQGNALCGHSQETEAASTCTSVMVGVALSSIFFLFTELLEKFW